MSITPNTTQVTLPKDLKETLKNHGHVLVWRCDCCEDYTTDGTSFFNVKHPLFNFALGINKKVCEVCSQCFGMNCCLCTKKMKECETCEGKHCPKCNVKNKGKCLY